MSIGVETFGSPTLEGLALNDDGSLKRGSKQYVKFYFKRRLSFRAKKDEFGNLFAIDKKSGLPVKETFEDRVLMVKIVTPGDKNEVDCIATDYHKSEFFRQYKAFMEGKGVPEGHLLEDFDFIQPSTIIELQRRGLHVLEQVASASDFMCDQIPELWEIREIAKDWLRINSPDGYEARVGQLQRANDELSRENESLKAKLYGANGEVARSFVMPEEVSVAPTDAPRTVEIDAEEFKKGKKK